MLSQHLNDQKHANHDVVLPEAERLRIAAPAQAFALTSTVIVSRLRDAELAVAMEAPPTEEQRLPLHILRSLGELVAYVCARTQGTRGVSGAAPEGAARAQVR